MDRKKIVAAILKEYRRHSPADQEAILLDVLKGMSDGNLLAFSIGIGIDTDQVLSGGELHEAL